MLALISALFINILFSGHFTDLTCKCINTLRPEQNGCNFADNTFKCTFLNDNQVALPLYMIITVFWFKFYQSLFQRVQLAKIIIIGLYKAINGINVNVEKDLWHHMASQGHKGFIRWVPENKGPRTVCSLFHILHMTISWENASFSKLTYLWLVFAELYECQWDNNMACHSGGHCWSYYPGTWSCGQVTATHLKMGHP